MHTLVVGSTGSGKTTLMKRYLRDAFIKNQSSLVIDPKGNVQTVTELESLRRSLQSEVPLKVFSIMNPGSSLHYNPIRHGTPTQKRDRIISSFEWSEQFYKNQASEWLLLSLRILELVGARSSLGLLYSLLTREDSSNLLLKKSEVEMSRELKLNLAGMIKQMRSFDLRDLSGLRSQLAEIVDSDFGSLFEESVDEDKNIDIWTFSSSHAVVLALTNTMAFPKIGRIVGKLILADLKSYASFLHSKNEEELSFLPIHVDEFGSFVSPEFIELLKMCRDLRFSLHLYMQSLSDLDVVAPELKLQVNQNCLTKVILRSDDPNEVDFWVGVAGTEDTVKESKQTKDVLFYSAETGLGNLRETKQAIIEHDVFKRLSTGQAVIIQKNPARHRLVKLIG